MYHDADTYIHIISRQGEVVYTHN